MEARRLALLACLGKLRKADRELIEERYASGENGLSVARKLGRPANSVYQSLGRIRRAPGHANDPTDLLGGLELPDQRPPDVAGRACHRNG